VALGRLPGRDSKFSGKSSWLGARYSATLVAAVGELLRSAGTS
jgi:hypothetical protein